DLRRSKLRPAVVLATTEADVVVCFITSQTSHRLTGDMRIKPTQINGLKYPSLIRIGKIATLSQVLAKGLIGRLGLSEMAVLDSGLKQFFQLL
ncbi:MAG TPA: hypothetical protein DDZ78_06060, partial [Porphyromonadaceae bacterium]|nr:hypothetical protein [Porphyromonadaceae bacterium]